MRFRSTIIFTLIAVVPATPLLASQHTRRGPTAQHFSSKKSSALRKPVAERVIDTDRTTQIQTALIAHGYMTGSPTGSWNPETQEALRKLQAENGWQTKMVPDSRAIIKLGLGPNSSAPEGAASSSGASGTPAIVDPELSTSSQN